jgi:hypothetical protein
MVARTRRFARDLEVLFGGGTKLAQKLKLLFGRRSRFAGANAEGAKFAQLAQLLLEGFATEVISGQKGVDGPARLGFRMPPILFNA